MILNPTSKVLSLVSAWQPDPHAAQWEPLQRFCRLPVLHHGEASLSHPAPDFLPTFWMQSPWILAIRAARPRRGLTPALATLSTAACKLRPPRQFSTTTLSSFSSPSTTLHVPNPANPAIAETMAPKAPKFEIK